jgi:hypothetical protein
VDEVKPVARVPTVEHREPCESRGSRTVLGAPGGEIPPGDSTNPDLSANALMSPSASCGHDAALALGSNVPKAAAVRYRHYQRRAKTPQRPEWS